MTLQNPFFVGGPVPPEQLVGRIRELNIAFDQIFNRNHLAISGSPGMGKSSMLRSVAAPQAWQSRQHSLSEAVVVYLNCAGINPFTAAAFWRRALQLVNDQSQADPALRSAIETALQKPAATADDLRGVLAHLGQRSKFLLLLVDDYDDALRTNDVYSEADMSSFVSEFRNLAVHTVEGEFLSNIVTSFRPLQDLGPKLMPSGSPWYNHYLFRPLKPFSEREATTLLNKMPTSWALNIEQQEAIRELCDGHPALLQNAAYLLFNTFREEPRLDASTFSRELVSATERYFQNAWAFCTDAEKLSLMLLALSKLEGRLNRRRRYNLGDVDIILSQMDRELRDLEGRGVVIQAVEQGNDVYSFASSIMEWWVIKEIENSRDEDELEQRQRVFLTLSRNQVAQIKGVVRQIWQRKDAAVELTGWTGRLLGAFGRGIAGGGAP